MRRICLLVASVMPIGGGASALTVARMPNPVPQECPGKLEGTWFRSTYGCGVVRAERPHLPLPHSSETTIEEWAATYRVLGSRVEVHFDGRYRSYSSLARDKPEWRQGPASRKVFDVIDDCTANSDQAWPRTVYRAGTGCRIPYDAYSWAPGAPGTIDMARALYVGRIVEGRLQIDRDPHSGIRAASTPIEIEVGRRSGPVRFLGREPYDLVDGRRKIDVDLWIPVDASEIPGSAADLAIMAVDRGDALRRAGDHGGALMIYTEAMQGVRGPSGPLQPAERAAYVMAMKSLLQALSRARQAGTGPEAETVQQNLSDALRAAAAASGVDDRIRAKGVAGILDRKAVEIEELLPTSDGRSEAIRVRGLR